MRIRLDGVGMRFGGRVVLDDVCFDDEVRALAVIGPSGGGKSTLLRIMGGLLAPTAGTVELGGVALPTAERDLPAYRARLGFVFQTSGLFEHLSARENVALPLRAVHGWGQERARSRADELLGRFGLADEAAKRPGALSGGQRQRVAIARAVAPEPALLLMDEPTSALDPEYTAGVLDLISDLRGEGTRFVIVTHEMGFARHACDHVAFLAGGRLAEYGPSEEVFGRPSTPELGRFLSRLLEWSV